VNTYTESFLPAAWIAIQRGIEAHTTQRDILADTLEQMLAAGANDKVIEALLAAIDAIDTAELDATVCDTTQDIADEPDDYPDIEQPEDSDRGDRQRIIAQLRDEGYVGTGFDMLVTLRHRDLAEDEWLRAENDCRGKLVRTEFQANYDARKFWFCNDREVRKYASPELLAWFDQYGRLTRAQLADNLLGKRHYSGSGYYNA
jgi:hypothetical protein